MMMNNEAIKILIDNCFNVYKVKHEPKPIESTNGKEIFFILFLFFIFLFY